jgi:hypothetical protein
MIAPAVNKWTALAVCAVAVAGLTASCGGSGGNGNEGRLSAAEFRDQAEAICKHVEETDVAEPSGPSDLMRYLDEFSGVIDEAAADFRALEPPEDFASQWNQYVRYVDEGAAKLHQLRDRAEGASLAEIGQLANELNADITRLAERGHAIERELGLDECVD